ncbi:MAG: DUF1343 domain-containing protein [Ignavibacteriales bacterium]|nr:DUF1343 domain-containing protein [Ignavibacteriales bacterium]
MKKLILFTLSIGSLLFSQVQTGIEALNESGFAQLKGKRIGLITNPTGITPDFRSTVDILALAKNCTLVALYGPEHGVRGDVPAGGYIESYKDAATGLPVYSLYGKTRKPTSEMLKGVEVLVYDIQDIGSRSYTYINTMAYAMEAAAEDNIEFVVLDRPNPLNGNRVEGNILDLKFRSFVGQYPIPYVYGMTCGEFATMLNEEGWLADGKKCKLTVIKMKNWKRSMHWEETGLPWVPTSPHVPNEFDAAYYSASGIIGELETVNIGVGYTMPFQLVGAEWINGSKLAEVLNAKNLPGVRFRPLSYQPFYGKQQGKQLHGVQIHISDKTVVNLTNLNLYIIEALIALYPDKNPFILADENRIAMFDKVMGTDAVRKNLSNGISAATIIASWQNEISEFMKLRKKYLLYE